MRRFFVFLTCVFLVACAPRVPTQVVDNPSTDHNEAVSPDSGQPAFPPLGQTWIIDNGCDFDPEYVQDADQVFEQLRQDNIAEVVVICQTGVKNFGPYNDEKIWTMEWGNWTKLGLENGRGVVILIRPDVRPEENRVTIENSVWLYQNTTMDYYPVIEEAAMYANYDDFNGCLEALARGLNTVLREVVKP